MNRGARQPRRTRDPYAPYGRVYQVGERVEICVGSDYGRHWIQAEYVKRFGSRTHVVRVDGSGSPMARRREVDSRSIRSIGGKP